jgi:hypothetical protein
MIIVVAVKAEPNEMPVSCARCLNDMQGLTLNDFSNASNFFFS